MKGKGLLLAIAPAASKKGVAESEGKLAAADESESSDFDTAAEEAFSALQDKDLEGFKLALKAAVQCCMSEDDYSDDEEE